MNGQEFKEGIIKRNTNRLVGRVRAGALSATVWMHRNSEGKEWHTVSLQRYYTDSEGNPQYSHSLRMDDLPKISFVIKEVYRKYKITVVDQE